MRALQEVCMKAATEEWDSGTCMQVAYSCIARSPKLLLHFALMVVAIFTAVGTLLSPILQHLVYTFHRLLPPFHSH